jgi:phage terminase large subunit GpA-like protein
VKFVDYLEAVELQQVSPLKGRGLLGKAPYLRAVAEAVDAPGGMVLVGAANSTGKTLLHVLLVQWRMRFQNGSGLLYTQDDDAAKALWINQLAEFFDKSPLVRSLKRRVVQGAVEFVTGDFFRVLAANSNNVNAFQVRHVTGTECHLWEAGILAAALKRGKGGGAYARFFFESTRGEVGSDFEAEISESTGASWHQCCPRCGHLFRLSVLDSQNINRFNPALHFDPAADDATWSAPGGVFIVCPACAEGWTDTRANRATLHAGGRFVEASPGRRERGFVWSALMRRGIRLRTS